MARGMCQFDTTGKIFRIKRREARDFARAGGAMYPGYQQAFAVLRGQKLDRIGNARRGTGQHDDTVGLAIERYLVAGNLGDEPAETTRQQKSGGSASSHRQESDPAGETCK